MKNNDQTKHIGFMIKCLDKRIVQCLNKELECLDLTLIQHQVLHYLLHKQGQHDVYQKEIEEFLESTNPTVTGIVKRMEAKGLICRTAGSHDARYKKLTLTDKGRHLVEQFKLSTIESKLTRYLSEEETDQLIVLLAKVFRGLDEA